MYAHIIHTKRLLCYWAGAFFLVWDGVQATTGELQPQICLQKPIAFSFIDFWDFPLLISGMALVARIVRPHYLSHTRTTERVRYMV